MLTQAPSDSLEGPEPARPIGPTRLVIASNGVYDVLLYHVGQAAFEMINAYGPRCDEMCLDGFTEAGIWVVEGSWHTWRGYEGDWDMEFRGKARAPTSEEWQAIIENRCPWQEEYACVAPGAER